MNPARKVAVRVGKGTKLFASAEILRNAPRRAIFSKPRQPTVGVAPSVSGEERIYKVLLEKEAVYKKPYFLV